MKVVYMNNPYILFALPYFVKIDEKRLDQTYNDLIFKNHPDQFSGEQQFSAIQVTESINKAYLTLKSVSGRANSMLDLLDIRIDEESTLHDIELLEEILEVRECGDRSTVEEKLEKAVGRFQKLFEMSFADLFGESKCRDMNSPNKSANDIILVAPQSKKNLELAYWRLVYLEKALNDLKD